MGLYKIDNVSSEEWHRRQMRLHTIKQWALVIMEIALIAGFVVGMWFFLDWASYQIKP